MERLTALRYVVPLREGGSLPAIVDTDRAGQFVVKFRGAGQGPKALIAEALAAGLARAVDVPVPGPSIVMRRGVRPRRAGPRDPGYPARELGRQLRPRLPTRGAGV